MILLKFDTDGNNTTFRYEEFATVADAKQRVIGVYTASRRSIHAHQNGGSEELRGVHWSTPEDQKKAHAVAEFINKIAVDDRASPTQLTNGDLAQADAHTKKYETEAEGAMSADEYFTRREVEYLGADPDNIPDSAPEALIRLRDKLRGFSGRRNNKIR